MAFSPSTVWRRVHRRLQGLPILPPGRPRDAEATRQVRRLRERLQDRDARIDELERLLVEAAEERRNALDRQLPTLIFHGASVRSAAECLEIVFGKEAPSKSTVAERIAEACEAARELFQEHFAGRGVAAACDEIYLSGHPCLDVVEPYSLAFTGIRPNTEPTREAWDALLKSFPELESAVSDQGKGVSQALAGRVLRFALDVWHLLRDFACAVGRLEGRACERIEETDRRREAFVAALPSFPPGKGVPPEMDGLNEAIAKEEREMRRYDDASLILGWLYEATEPVDDRGQVKVPGQIQGDWEAALDLVDHVDAEALYPLERKLRGKVDGASVRGLKERLGAVPLPKGWSEFSREEMQRLTCLAWRYHHRRGTHLLEAPREAAAWVAGRLGAPFAAQHLEAYCRDIFKALDLTLRASSGVECVNSVIRLREGAKRHANPGFVYLMAWLHNTRRFNEGRRKGLTPAEILGVRLPDDGLTMLLERMDANRRARDAKRFAA